MSTPFHAAYWAHCLTAEGPPGSVESISRSLSSARVDLNPHQVEAAIFALRSPMLRGVLLADEVGLGKTIEAGLVLAQRWAEGRRRLLLIVPASLRKQWHQELLDKFHLPAVVMESSRYRERREAGNAQPFDDTAAVVVCSYPFAAAKRDDLAAVDWDLVVLDEAHRLRGVYRPSAKTALALREALSARAKLLLTATPLQNSLLELFGLVSFLDEHVLGTDVEVFREQFLRPQNESLRNARLRERLAPVSRRTLRSQVQAYVRFTNRVPLTQRFVPTAAEQRLYEEVSTYLQREMLHALPRGQRALLTMVLRKLLASSTFAIAGTLGRMVERLEKVERGLPAVPLVDDEDLEGLAETADEWSESEPAPAAVDAASLRAELDELRRYAAEAEAIAHNAKGDALLEALARAFVETAALGAARKAVVFTESRRTQAYLARFLAENGYAGEIVQINGSNSDPEARRIHAAWLERHRGSDRVTGQRAVDVKAALVEEFQQHGTLLIATESAGEGVNLQFCSLVVNYDLPWNPQRIEQRIGRCHRYGQKHDVVVVNFLNERNAADQRVFELLAEKFRLFEGVFGASDEILGAVESGVDIERRIAEVYQTCRTEQEIARAFAQLRADLETQIDERMRATRRSILEHFDEEVHQRLDGVHTEAGKLLKGRQDQLWRLAKTELAGRARFDDSDKCFAVTGQPRDLFLDWPIADDRDGVFFHPEHELAREIIATAKARPLGAAELTLRYTAPPRISALESLIGQSGWLAAALLRVTARHREEHVVVVARTDTGVELPPETAPKLFQLAAQQTGPAPEPAPAALRALRERETARLTEAARRRNEEALRAEEAKLEQWSEDAKEGLERELKELDREIRATRKEARAAPTLDGKLEQQRRIKDLESRRSRRRRELFDRQDEIEAERDRLIAEIERQLALSYEVHDLFTIRFHLVDGEGGHERSEGS